ncbi:GNAT family N-acetyltransferase [Leptobacterium flavescens]|nr:GNAT family N-acetyltransferase [Leptobacterium flavescens]
MPQKFESERLIIRTFNDTDWKDLHDYYSDTETTKYTFGRVLSEGETWRTVASMVGHWSIRGYGPYALEEKGSGKIIGVSGLWYPADWPEPEIKWGLSRTFQGKGYASEAARKVKEVAKEYLPEMSLISLIHSKNSPSIKLALAIGANFEKEILFREDNWSIYRHH